MRKSTCSKCGLPLETERVNTNQRYCKQCHAEYMRLHRPKHSELNEEQRKKANSRSYANVYVKRGKIQSQPCEMCQNPNAEKHHPDYNKPTDVKWLCRECHLELHRSIETDVLQATG